jgi:hypothetical protein
VASGCDFLLSLFLYALRSVVALWFV